MKDIFLVLTFIFLSLNSFSQLQYETQYTLSERLEINSNNNFETVNNNSVQIDFSSVDKNLQGEIKDELSGMIDKFIIFNLDESTNTFLLRWNNQFSLNELIEILAHFGLNDTSIIHPWQ